MSAPQDDSLERAIDSLRAFAREVPPEAGQTRSRVLGRPHRGTASRTKAVLFALGLLAVGAPALAHFTGDLTVLWQRVTAWFGGEADRPRSDAGRTRNASESRAKPATSPASMEPPPSEARSALNPGSTPAPGSDARSASDVKLSRVESAPPGADADSHARAAEPDGEGEGAKGSARALYLVAHRAHFGGGSAENALRAWDAFLAAAPNDSFAPEARYNRAIALLRLARYELALAALEPFACAEQGAYRQREARALIAAARSKQPRLRPLACEKNHP